jgi:antitoxin PrlF
MAVATISSKGQITLPAEARRAIGVSAGDRVHVRIVDGAIVIEPVRDFLSLRGLAGRALPSDVEEAAMQSEAAQSPSDV